MGPREEDIMLYEEKGEVSWEYITLSGIWETPEMPTNWLKDKSLLQT